MPGRPGSTPASSNPDRPRSSPFQCRLDRRLRVDPRSSPDRPRPTPGRSRIDCRLRVNPGSSPRRPRIEDRSGLTPGRSGSPSRRSQIDVDPGSLPGLRSIHGRPGSTRIDPGSAPDRLPTAGWPLGDPGSMPDRPRIALLPRLRVDSRSTQGRPRVDPCGSLSNRCHRVDPGSIRWSIPDRPWSDPDRHADPVWSGVNRRLQVDPCSTRIDPDQPWVDPGSSVDCGASPGRCRPSRSPVDPG